MKSLGHNSVRLANIRELAEFHKLAERVLGGLRDAMLIDLRDRFFDFSVEGGILSLALHRTAPDVRPYSFGRRGLDNWLFWDTSFSVSPRQIAFLKERARRAIGIPRGIEERRNVSPAAED